ncbi:M20/M25/M40 family metallo-hydrolase [SAR202 cluster bacterium AC-409-J13_OGT_754m]|nr:M20/M25/M40 family metallo-hydrolase [SAR202 cluster bacterium AC-409-J13_OGT_754m]
MIDESRLIKTFCDIVQIDSPSGYEEDMAVDLIKRLSDLGLDTQRDTYGNLIASETGDNPLLLSAHMDTVEPGRGIKPIVMDGQIRSDGTTILGGDCKAGVAAILEALQSIKEDGVDRIPIQLVFTREEEIGLVGARNLDMNLISAKEGVVFDGNGPVSKLTVASPTYMSIEVDITGRSAHAGVEPEKGLSAIRIAADIITRLPQGRIDEETTFNIGTISGGSVRNTVPEKASFTGEFRSRNLESVDLLRLEVLQALDDARGKYKDAIIDGDLKVEFKMYYLSDDDSMVERSTRVLAELGLEAEIGPSGGGTDANIFIEKGMKCIVVGMSTREMHTVREYVPVNDLVNTARFCETILKKHING